MEPLFFHCINAHTAQCDLSNHVTSPAPSSLMDGRANGGMTGSDVCVISSLDFHKATVNVIWEICHHLTPFGDCC
jgi:hypothetical protein